MGAKHKSLLIKYIDRLQYIFFWLFILFSPTQLALHLWPKWSYVLGIRVDYLSLMIYFTDLLFFVLLIFWVVEENLDRNINTKKIKASTVFYIIIFFLLIFLNTLLSSNAYLAIIKWIKVLELGLLAIFISRKKKFKLSTWFLKPIFISLIFVNAVAIVQFFKKGTIGGFMYLLGERTFDISTPGIALINFLGRQFMRPYSLFSHPNSYAGFIGAVFVLSLLYTKQKVGRKERYLKNAFIASSTIGLFLSFSKTAWIGLLIILPFYVVMKKRKVLIKQLILGYLLTLILLSLFMPIFASKYTESFVLKDNIKQRLVLSIKAGKLISVKPLFGVGLNNFITNLSLKWYEFPNDWILQPVHNIYLLIFSELGLIGLTAAVIFLFYLIKKCVKKDKIILLLALVFVLTSGFFDHYWITLQQNEILLATIIGLIIRDENIIS